MGVSERGERESIASRRKEKAKELYEKGVYDLKELNDDDMIYDFEDIVNKVPRNRYSLIHNAGKRGSGLR
jgi:hypothetical protein